MYVLLIAGAILISSNASSIAQGQFFSIGQQALVMEYDDGTEAIALDAFGVSDESTLRVGSGFSQLKIDPFDRVILEFSSSSTLDRAFEINTLSEGETFVVTKGGTVAWRVKRSSEGAEILCSDSDFYGDNLLYELTSCPDNVASLPLVVDAQAEMIAELQDQVESLTSLVATMRSELDALKTER
jgi:hypothetical protein